MTRSAQLARIETQHDDAFDLRRHTVYISMQQAWRKRKNSRFYYDEAYDTYQRARQVNESLQGLRGARVFIEECLVPARERLEGAIIEYRRSKKALQRAETKFVRLGELEDWPGMAKKREAEKSTNIVLSRLRDYEQFLSYRAEVPKRYRHKMKLSVDFEGYTNIYFGGVRAPGGPNHGHYVLGPGGRIIYRRNPFETRGPHNFIGPYNDGLQGGFGVPRHGWVYDDPVTFAFGWGTRRNHAVYVDGHLGNEEFVYHTSFDYYEPNEGPHVDGTLRRTQHLI